MGSLKACGGEPLNEAHNGRGYAMHGHCFEALQLIQHMQHQGPEPNNRTWTAILAGYSQQGHGKDASQLFQQMSYEGLERSAITWNALISGFVFHGQGQEALEIYHQMVMEECCPPDSVTYMNILKACADILDLLYGKLIHNQMLNIEGDVNVAVQTTLIDMYVKCGSLEDALNLFEKLLHRDVVSWNTMIAGYVLHGLSLDALRIFEQMQSEGAQPDNATFLSILKACSLVSGVNLGNLIHALIIESSMDTDVFILSSLIEMYAVSGSFRDACHVFDQMPKKDIVGWNALIAGVQSNYPSVYQLLEDMGKKGLVPDRVTFLSLLSACSSIGSIADGTFVFNSMREVHGVAPTNEHYACMVDLLGSVGGLFEAEDLLHVMPLRPMVIPWTSLLNSSKVYNDVELAEQCFEHVVDIDESCASAYISMSNIYTTAGLPDDVGKMKDLRQQSNAWKKPGRAYIEVEGVVHGFVVGDNVHAQSEAIHEKLGLLVAHLKKEGHVWHS